MFNPNHVGLEKTSKDRAIKVWCMKNEKFTGYT